jgi:hypothetical protein
MRLNPYAIISLTHHVLTVPHTAPHTLYPTLYPTHHMLTVPHTVSHTQVGLLRRCCRYRSSTVVALCTVVLYTHYALYTHFAGLYWSPSAGGASSSYHYLFATMTVPTCAAYCTHTVPILYPYCTLYYRCLLVQPTVPILYPYCTHTVPILYSYCTHTVLYSSHYTHHTIGAYLCSLGGRWLVELERP